MLNQKLWPQNGDTNQTVDFVNRFTSTFNGAVMQSICLETHCE